MTRLLPLMHSNEGNLFVLERFSMSGNLRRLFFLCLSIYHQHIKSGQHVFIFVRIIPHTRTHPLLERNEYVCIGSLE